MPDGLTTPADPPTEPPTGPSADLWTEPEEAPPSRRGAWRQACWVVLIFAVAGAGAGVLWWVLWTPPSGVVVAHVWYPSETGLRRDFAGTGWYVVVAATAGLALGILTAYFFDRAELVTLFAVCVGSVLAAWLMLQVGARLGPADPVSAAKHTKDNEHLQGDLRVHGSTPWLALPTGAILGVGSVFFATPGRGPAKTRTPD